MAGIIWGPSQPVTQEDFLFSTVLSDPWGPGFESQLTSLLFEALKATQ